MELYHTLNRGVDKRIIFLDDADRKRFVYGLTIFNDTRPAENSEYFYSRATGSVESIDLRGRYEPKKRKRLVDIHGWCLMGNHYHLLLSEVADVGITRFLMKLNVGYAKYFNKRHERVGTLFQGRTKKILIDSDAHFLHILHYIHLNPLDFLKGAESWRGLELKNRAAAVKHLDAYKWSSFRDYCGKRNFPHIVNTDLFGDVFGDYRKTIKNYLADMDIEPIGHFLLE